MDSGQSIVTAVNNWFKETWQWWAIAGAILLSLVFIYLIVALVLCQRKGKGCGYAKDLLTDQQNIQLQELIKAEKNKEKKEEFVIRRVDETPPASLPASPPSPASLPSPVSPPSPSTNYNNRNTQEYSFIPSPEQMQRMQQQQQRPQAPAAIQQPTQRPLPIPPPVDRPTAQQIAEAERKNFIREQYQTFQRQQ